MLLLASQPAKQNAVALAKHQVSSQGIITAAQQQASLATANVGRQSVPAVSAAVQQQAAPVTANIQQAAASGIAQQYQPVQQAAATSILHSNLNLFNEYLDQFI
jgi:hypothetical protein